MRKIVLLSAVLAAFALNANAHGFGHNVSGDASAGSVAATGSLSASGVLGNGFAANGTQTFAGNESSAGSTADFHGHTVEGATYGTSEGATGTKSWGVQYGHSLGITGGGAVQGGFGQGSFEGHY